MSTALPGEDSTPLTDREQRQATRLLSDPSVYPAAFKGWLVPFLEISDLNLPMTSVHGLVEQLFALSVSPLERLPSGTVLLFAGTEAPEGTQFHTPQGPLSGLLNTSGLRLIRVT